MALELDNLMFYHMGRSGGHTLRMHLARESSVVREVGSFHSTPYENRNIFHSNKVSFCVIRHPFAWLASLWRHNVFWGPISPDSYLDGTFAFSFEEFLKNLLHKHGKDIINIPYHEYAENVDVVLRTEKLSKDLALIRKSHLGEKMQEQYIENSPPNFLRDASKCSKELLVRIYKYSYPWFSRFGYKTDLADYVGSPAPLKNLYVALNSDAAHEARLNDLCCNIQYKGNFTIVKGGGENAFLIHFFLDEIKRSGMHDYINGDGLAQSLSRTLNYMLMQKQEIETDIKIPILCDHLRIAFHDEDDDSWLLTLPKRTAAVILDIAINRDVSKQYLDRLRHKLQQYGTIIFQYTTLENDFDKHSNRLVLSGHDKILFQRFLLRIP